MTSEDDILRAMMSGDEMSTVEVAQRLSLRKGNGALITKMRRMQKKGYVQSRGLTDTACAGRSNAHVFQITEVGMRHLRTGAVPPGGN